MKLVDVASLLLVLSLGVDASPAPRPAQVGAGTIAAKWATKNRYFGCATDASGLKDAKVLAIVQRECAQLTPENSMKWDTTEYNRNQFNFKPGDELMEFARATGKKVRGHAAVWHSQLPSWVSQISDKKTLTDVIERHVSTLLGHYKGKVFAWDVVNEPLNEDGTMRESVFYKVLGEDYIRIAFEAARKADPAAKLYVNDYNLDDINYAKTKGMIEKVKKWRAAGIPIDGVGSQGHVSSQWNTAGTIPAAFKALCAVAPECALTEIDIHAAPPADYAKVATVCLEISNCVGVTVWGTTDNYSWRAASTPLLFDGSGNKKPAYTAILNAS